MTNKSLKREYFKLARKDYNMPYYMAVQFSKFKRHGGVFFEDFLVSLGGVEVSSEKHHCFSCDCDCWTSVYQMPDGDRYEVDDHHSEIYKED